MLFAFLTSAPELAVVGVLAVMLFGKNLPDVARQVGRGWADIKKSLSGIQSEFNSALYSDSSTGGSSSSRSSSYTNAIDDYEEQTAPKFEPPPAEPTNGESTSHSA